MHQAIKTALVVEDDADVREGIVRIVRRWGTEVAEARTAAAARALLDSPPPPDLMIVDVRLPDEDAFGLLNVAAKLSPAPVVVAISGKASPNEAFRLAQSGARAYLAKPFSIDELTAQIEAAFESTPPIAPWVSAYVGHISMRELQREVRRVMMNEALARSEGNRTGAARLLEVSRQAVQQMLRNGGDGGEDSANTDLPQTN